MEQTATPPYRKRFRAEMFDMVQFTFQDYNDHQIHAVLSFEETIEPELFAQALRCSLRFVPILSCRFVADRVRPYWEQADESCLQRLSSFLDIKDAAPESAIQEFITSKTDESTGPQVMTRIIRSSGKDTLCIVANHMVCDGAGFKEYLYLLGEIYTRLQNGTYEEMHRPTGSRSAWQIYRNFSLFEKLKAFSLLNESTKGRNTVRFPLSQEADAQTPHILTHTLSPDRFKRLQEYRKKHTATVNDVILAAYFRALNQMLTTEQSESLTIPCMIDLRRHLSTQNAAAICNLAAMITCHIGTTANDSFAETLAKVSTLMHRRKSAYLGLNGLFSLAMIYQLPFHTTYELFKKHFTNPMIGMTNIGIIDARRLVFGTSPLQNAYVTGSIKYPPYFQLALTTYNNAITFTVNQYCHGQDEATIQHFFSLLDRELSF